MPRDDALGTDEYAQLTEDGINEEQEVYSGEVLEDVEEVELDEYSRDFSGDAEVQTNSWENRINQYETAAEKLDLNPDLIYEPANGGDISTIEAFPDSEVLFAEVRELAAESVNREGYNVTLADAEILPLSEEPDLVVFRNSAIDETQTLEQNSAEYVFANDWLGSASNVSEMDSYDIVGIVSQNETYFESADSMSLGESPDDLYVFQRTN